MSLTFLKVHFYLYLDPDLAIFVKKHVDPVDTDPDPEHGSKIKSPKEVQNTDMNIYGTVRIQSRPDVKKVGGGGEAVVSVEPGRP